MIAIFNDAIDAKTKYNSYVKPYLQDVNFPKKGSLDEEKFDILLKKWINNNPIKINKLLADRKKSHDKLYGPRKK